MTRGECGSGSGVVPHNACGLRGCCGLVCFWQEWQGRWPWVRGSAWVFNRE